MRSTPERTSTPRRTRDQSASGMPEGAAIVPLLRRQLLNLDGVVPACGKDAPVLVVPGEPPDPGLEELQAPPVRGVPWIQLQVGLQRDCPAHEVAQVLGDLHLHAL